MKKAFLIYFLLFLSSCNMTNYYLYNKGQMNGIDFSNGNWLIGDIEVNPYVKTKITNLALTDLREYLGNRMKYYEDDRALLLPKQIPINPSKSQILDLKKGANFDYFINIKCKNAKNDLSNFEHIDHFYYKKQMSFAKVVFEVYDLNNGEIIYSQTAEGSIEDDNSLTLKPTSTLIIGCYNKIINDIKKKSIKQG